MREHAGVVEQLEAVNGRFRDLLQTHHEKLSVCFSPAQVVPLMNPRQVFPLIAFSVTASILIRLRSGQPSQNKTR